MFTYHNGNVDPEALRVPGAVCDKDDHSVSAWLEASVLGLAVVQAA